MSDWRTADLKVLQTLNAKGMTPEQIATHITGHSAYAIRKKGYAIGLSWRRPGSRKGLVLGQPRNVSLKHDEKTAHLCELIRAGRIKPHVIATRLELATRADAELCPTCSRRPVTVQRTGLCVVCHKAVLIEIQQEQLAALEARKVQQVVWQQKSRLKKALEEEA